MIIQIILIVAVLAIALAVLRMPTSSRNTAVSRLVGLLMTLTAIVMIIRPELASKLANLVGVGRGTDLMLYAAIVAFMLSLVSAARKRVVLDQKITRLARAVALTEAIEPDAEWPEPFAKQALEEKEAAAKREPSH